MGRFGKFLACTAFPDCKNIKSIKQTGSGSFYPKRTGKDSELDVNKSIAEQFDLLRVVDNEKYPAFFNFRGRKYVLRIYKDE